MKKEICVIEGKALVHRDADIDTDRIIPSRFLKLLTFDHLGKHVFNDERKLMRQAGKTHPFDDPQRQGAKILLAGPNFGCGSSREHAPQALFRWGVRAIVGTSYGEIFSGNSVAIGMPLLSMPEETVNEISDLVEKHADLELVINLESKTLKIPAVEKSYSFDIPEGTRKQFLTGQWDQTALLYEACESVLEKARNMPYIRDFPYPEEAARAEK